MNPAKTKPAADSGSDDNRARKRRNRSAIIVTLIAALAFGALVVIAGNDGDDPATTASGANSSNESQVVKRQADDPMAVGDVDAPVVLSQWTDFRCPFCALFNRDTLPVIVDEYVDSGKVRIEVHDVAFYGRQSMDAAVASRAAGEQGKFFEYMKAVYAEAPEKGHPEISRDDLVAFARKAGVPDVDRFRSDLDAPDIRRQARESNETAQGIGVNSVPFFVAGDTALSGAQPVEVFRDFLDEAIRKAG